MLPFLRPRAPYPVFRPLWSAYAGIVRALPAFLRIAAPWAVMLPAAGTLPVIAAMLAPDWSAAALIAALGVHILGAAAVAVRWASVAAGGPAPAAVAAPRLDRATLIVAGGGLLCALIAAAGLGAAAWIVSARANGEAPDPLLLGWLVLAAACAFAGLQGVRLLPCLAAVAAGQPPRPLAMWRAQRGGSAAIPLGAALCAIPPLAVTDTLRGLIAGVLPAAAAPAGVILQPLALLAAAALVGGFSAALLRLRPPAA